MLPPDAGATLLPLARAAIATALGVQHASANGEAAWLQAPGACFVTLTQHGQLRGCIGTLEARRSLLADAQANAIAAALRDPRFAPLSTQELDTIQVEVSVLSAVHAFSFRSEADALDQLRPGEDGVVLECDGRRATFLPQVWEQLPDRSVFLAHLKHKAGLPADFWSDEVRLYRYTVSKWVEHPG
jgi:AmmeMemoRadiSam system protein A